MVAMLSLKMGFPLCMAVASLAMVKEGDSKDPMAKAFDTMGYEEKMDFLAYFLARSLKDWAESQPRPPKFISPKKSEALIKGLKISEENIQKFEKLNIPKESRKKLLEWTKSEFNLTTRNVLDLLKTKKCQGPACVGLPDIGEICCPW